MSEKCINVSYGGIVSMVPICENNGDSQSKSEGFMKKLLAAVVLTAMAVLQTNATFFQNATGIASPVTTITFDEHLLPQDTSLTTQFADVGVTFAGAYFSSVYTFPNIASPQAANFSQADPSSTVVNPFSIHF